MTRSTEATPWSRYEADLQRPDFVEDEAQRRAVRAIQEVFDQVVNGEDRPTGLLGRLRRSRPTAVRGLYLWGGVGRGKTYLMDCFHDCLPEGLGRRVHFHRFMEDVHDRLAEYAAVDDPLQRIGADLAADHRVLCFDEFFVSDIADAMILAGLLEALFAAGVTLIATSNVAPENLYRDGLQRAKFLPAIALLEKHCDVLQVDGGTDYRLRILTHAEIYITPHDAAAEELLAREFEALAPGEWEADRTIHVNHRKMATRAVADGIAWLTFEELCVAARSASDYIELGRRFNTVLISGVPVMGEGTNDPARRFINLIDELYDRNVNVVLSAEAPLDELYHGRRLAFEFERTKSRLTEMQTEEYLAQGHRC